MMMKAGHRQVLESGTVSIVAGGRDLLVGRAVSGALAMPGYGVALVE